MATAATALHYATWSLRGGGHDRRRVWDMLRKHLSYPMVETPAPLHMGKYFVVHAQTGSRGGERPFDQRPPWVAWSGNIASRQRWSGWLLLGVADSFQAAVAMAWQPRSDKSEAAYSIDFDYTITSFKTRRRRILFHAHATRLVQCHSVPVELERHEGKLGA